MPDEGYAGVPAAPPDVDRMAALPDDVWRRVVPHLRRALAGLSDHEHSVATRRLASLPTSRLVAGRSRREVARRLAEGGPLWQTLRARLVADVDLAETLGRTLAAAPRPEASASPTADAGADPRELDRLRDRLRRTRGERDDARRRADGEAARADREATARHELEQQVQALQRRVAELEAEVAAAGEDREAAVARERRRTRAARDELREELRALRREQEESHRRRQAEARAREVRDRQPTGPTPPAPPRLVPGRPSRLPDQVAAGTTEAVDLLLHADRQVLVDGYNVTRSHRADLDLEGQRRWLVNLLAGAVATRGIVPTVVFDGHGSAGPGSGRRERGVWIRFTAAGMTADDDLVFQVEATDPGTPLVVVTDDRELRDRLAPSRVDLVATSALVGALR